MNQARVVNSPVGEHDDAPCNDAGDTGYEQHPPAPADVRDALRCRHRLRGDERRATIRRLRPRSRTATTSCASVVPATVPAITSMG